MKTRPVLLFYCQHSLGMGHLVRSLALATSLAERFRVVLLNGGPLPRALTPPDAVEVISLPPLGMAPDGSLFSHDRRRRLERAQQRRQDLILSAFQTLCPQVVFIELFPFGRKKFAGELLPLLEKARNMGAQRPLVLCSLRDILVSQRRDQAQHDERASLLANQYFDAVLVHADPTFARLEESFRPRSALRLPVYYTGFVVAGMPPIPASTRPSSRQIVVSAGGGVVGEPLLREAIEAHALLWPATGLRMQVVAGPFLPEAAWQSLCAAVRGQQGLELRRMLPHLGARMHTAVASISQCGYNTALDILQAQVPALVVPFVTAQEDEQMRRARRLEQLGAVRVLDPQRLQAPTLAAEIMALLHFQPQAVTLDMAGVQHTAALVHRLAKRPRPLGAVASPPATQGVR